MSRKEFGSEGWFSVGIITESGGGGVAEERGIIRGAVGDALGAALYCRAGDGGEEPRPHWWGS